MVLYRILDIDQIIVSEILVSSKGITTLQKFLFSHTFIWDSSFFFIAKNEDDSDKKNDRVDVIRFNNTNSFFTAR